jgi:hypothetical protein
MKRNKNILSKEIGPEVTVEGRENMFKYHEQKLGTCYNIKTVNNSLKIWQRLNIWGGGGEKCTKSKCREEKLSANLIQKMPARIFW